MPTWGADERYLALVEKHGTGLLHLALMLTGNRHDAEDVVQDALIAVAAKWPIAAGATYLKRTVSNGAIDLIRSRREVPAESLPERAVEDYSFLKREQDRAFFDLLQGLPTRQRQAVILRYYADLDDTSIARILGVTVQTVRSQIHHALARLRTTVPAEGRS
jgi:RNA polymerase sigma factor (sigma-70 family)